MGCRQAATTAILTAGLDRASNWVDLEAPVRHRTAPGALAGDSNDSSAAHISPELPRLEMCLALAARRAIDNKCLAAAMDTVDFLLLRKWLIANGHAPLVVLFEDILLFRTVVSAGSRLRLGLGILASCQASALPLAFEGVTIDADAAKRAGVPSAELEGIEQCGGYDIDQRFRVHVDELSATLSHFATGASSSGVTDADVPVELFDNVCWTCCDLMLLELFPHFALDVLETVFSDVAGASSRLALVDSLTPSVPDDDAAAAAAGDSPGPCVKALLQFVRAGGHISSGGSGDGAHESGHGAATGSTVASGTEASPLPEMDGGEFIPGVVVTGLASAPVVEIRPSSDTAVARAAGASDATVGQTAPLVGVPDSANASDGSDISLADILSDSSLRLPTSVRPVTSDDFRKCGIIGSGSYGRVEVWQRKASGTFFAVKSMSKRALKVRQSVRASLRELFCTTAVQSPFVCSIDYAFESPDEVHFAMRMAWGGDLERLLLTSRDRRFKEPQVVFYAAQMVLGLRDMHRVGIVHRDLKASNVLLDERGNVMIADLGLAIMLHSCYDGRGKGSFLLSSVHGKHVAVTEHTPTTVEIPEGYKDGCPGSALSRLLDRINDLKGPRAKAERRARKRQENPVGAVTGAASEAGLAGASSRTSSMGDAAAREAARDDFTAADAGTVLPEVELDAGERLRLRRESAVPIHERWYKGKAGTPAYWAPEMLRMIKGRTRRNGEQLPPSRVPYGTGADWFSFGCVVVALFTGRSPFASGRGADEDNRRTLEGLRPSMFHPDIFSPIAMDFCCRLLHPKPSIRLGAGPDGWEDVMRHPFFKDVDWDLLQARTIPPPIVPPYRMRVDLMRVPSKVDRQDAHGDMEDAERRLRDRVEACTLDHHDEACFGELLHVNPRLGVVEAADRIELLTNPSARPYESPDMLNIDEGRGAVFRPRRPADATVASDVMRGAMALRERGGAAMVFQLGSRSITAIEADGFRDKEALAAFRGRVLKRLPSPPEDDTGAPGSGEAVSSAAAGAGGRLHGPLDDSGDADDKRPTRGGRGPETATTATGARRRSGGAGAAVAAKAAGGNTSDAMYSAMAARVSQIGPIVDDSQANPSPRAVRRISTDASAAIASGPDAARGVTSTVVPHGATRPASAAHARDDSRAEGARPKQMAQLCKLASVARHDNTVLGEPEVPVEFKQHSAAHAAAFEGVEFVQPSAVVEANARMSIVPGHGSTAPFGVRGKFNSVMSVSQGFGSRAGSMMSRTGSTTPGTATTPGGFAFPPGGTDSTHGSFAVQAGSGPRRQAGQGRFRGSSSTSTGLGRGAVRSIASRGELERLDEVEARGDGRNAEDEGSIPETTGHRRAQTPVEIHVGASTNAGDEERQVEANPVGVTRPDVAHGRARATEGPSPDGGGGGGARTAGGCCVVC